MFPYGFGAKNNEVESNWPKQKRLLHRLNTLSLRGLIQIIKQSVFPQKMKKMFQVSRKLLPYSPYECTCYFGFSRFTFVRLTYMAILLLLTALLARFSTHRSKHDESVSTCPGVKSKRYRGGNFGVFGFSACTFLLLCIHAWLYVNYLGFRRKTDEQRCELNVITFVIIFTLLRREKIFRLNCPCWRCIR